MAKVIKRIGTLAQKFSVDITVHAIQMTLSIPVLVNIIWKRKKRRVESKNKSALAASAKSCQIEETLTMINTLYQKKSGEFLEKKAVLTFQAIVENRGTKVVGSVSLNIAQFVRTGIFQQEFKIEKCPDKAATAVLSLRAQAMGELVEADNMSDVSGGTGFSMGTEDFGGGLISEQDLTGFDDEPHPNSAKIFTTGNLRPAIPRAPVMPGKSERQGPVKPLHNLDVSDQSHDRQPTPLQVLDLQSRIFQLERTNEELTKEKDDLKAQFQSLMDSGKRERDQLIEHIQ